jgi:hypothetical protein
VITWSLGHALPVKLEPELELTINQAPAGVKMPVDFTVAYVSKRDGRIANCRLSDNQAAVPAVIWGLACQSLEGQRGEIVVDHAGKPVEAMNNTMVRISVKP